MKTPYAVILAAILGVAGGMGIAMLRLSMSPWDGTPAGASTYSGRNLPPGSGDLAPKVVVDHVEHDFGKMDVHAEGSHDFIFSNGGDAPLVLTAGRTSCSCAVSEIEDREIPVGRSTKVTLKWTAKGTSHSYQETALIRTNDPERREVTLTVLGRVIETVRAVPPVLVFYQASAHESTTRDIPLYCYADEPLKILGATLANQSAAGHFEVNYEKLTAEQLQQEPDATSGYLITVTIKPGLPLGRFAQRILFATNLDLAGEVVVPIQVNVTGDITVVGRQWDNDARLLDLGTVGRSQGITRRLFLFVHGQYSETIDFTVKKVFPEDVLQVKLGEITRTGEGKSARVTLFIEIPKGSPPANHLSSQQGKLGSILIGTTHPHIPELSIRVRFAVTD